MIVQDLSPKELKICAALYSTTDSILFSFHATEHMVSLNFLTLDKIRLQEDGMSVVGMWFGRPFYTVASEIIRLLLSKGLIMLREEHKQEFYILNICEELKEFFRELEV